jgi:dinuclear metal center YbgI/SA1388 family protein
LYDGFMNIKELDIRLKEKLLIDDYHKSDSSLNGIQVACSQKEVKKVVCAVDACQLSIDQARQLGADMLFVHHGIFWGRPLAVEGSHYRRVKALLDADICLYACHLPLDAHAELGNNIAIAELLGIESPQPFGFYKGSYIGYQGRLKEDASLEDLIHRMDLPAEEALSVLPFGPEKISSVAVISGGGVHDLPEAIGQGVDLYITGDTNHILYHSAAEEGINVLSAGHYWTETFGVKRVAAWLHESFGIDTQFIDIPTAL